MFPKYLTRVFGRRQKPHDPNAPYDGYNERDDTEKSAREKQIGYGMLLSICFIPHNKRYGQVFYSDLVNAQ